ncbi:uncharacterized protein V3H82_014470 isoform 2-T2 [Fundulus diaphanus]
MSAPLTALLLWTLMVFSSFMVVSADQRIITAESGETVILPCRAPENKTVTAAEWRTTDMDFREYLILYQNKKVDREASCPSFKNRTDLQDVENGDASLVLQKVTTADTGIYQCWIVQGRNDRRKRADPEDDPTIIINLRVQPDRRIIPATQGDTVILPCRAPENEPDGDLDWSRTDLESGQYVVMYRNGKFDQEVQSPSFRNRVDLQDIKNGDVSLVLKKVMTDDTGTYECRVVQKGNSCRRTSSLNTEPLSIINLRVEPAPFPSWAKVLLVLLVLVLIVAGLLYHFRLCFMSEYNVVVDSGEESVLLPCRTRPLLPGDARVEWRDRGGRKVHVYENGSDHPEEQDKFYRNRTKMKRNLLRTGDLSLILEHPTDGDTKIYTCIVFRGKRNILMKKQVDFKVKVPQVEVDSGEESVLLPCRTTVTLDGDARVEWRDSNRRMVHVYENGSDQHGEQEQFYRNRTKMNEDLLRTGDLSLTLEHPTDGDTNIYTCSVSRGKGNILMKKQVDLKVKVHQVEVEEGVESVLLPFTTTSGLPGDAGVEWWDNKDRKVHVYKNGSDQPEEQDQFYRNRTKMKEDLLRTGDLSLTLMSPTKEDSGEYECLVWKDGEVLRRKKVHLTVNGRVHEQNQLEDIRTRTSYIDPTPLMAVQSV